MVRVLRMSMWVVYAILAGSGEANTQDGLCWQYLRAHHIRKDEVVLNQCSMMSTGIKGANRHRRVDLGPD